MPTIVNTEGNRFISFAIGEDHALWYQESDDSYSWGDWKTLGGNLSQIVVTRSKYVGVQVFAIDRASRALLRIWRGSGTWSGWNNMGGSLKQITAADSPFVGLEVFGIDTTTGGVLRRWEGNGTWSGWNTLGGNVTQIAVWRSPFVNLQVFGVHNDGSLVRIWEGSGTWSGWNSLGGSVKRIAVSQSQAVGLQVFGISKTNGSLVRIWEGSGTWSGWNSDLGGVNLRRITTARQPNGFIQVFALGGDDRAYRIQENIGPPIHWGGWQHVVVGNPFDDGETESAPTSPKNEYELSPKTRLPSINFVPVEQPCTSDDNELESDSERAKRLYKQCMWGYIGGVTAVTGGAAAIAGGQVAIGTVAVVGGVAAIKSAEISCEEANEVAQSTSSPSGGPATNRDGGIHGTDTYGNGPVRAGADTWYL